MPPTPVTVCEINKQRKGCTPDGTSPNPEPTPSEEEEKNWEKAATFCDIPGNEYMWDQPEVEGKVKCALLNVC